MFEKRTKFLEKSGGKISGQKWVPRPSGGFEPQQNTQVHLKSETMGTVGFQGSASKVLHCQVSGFNYV